MLVVFKLLFVLLLSGNCIAGTNSIMGTLGQAKEMFKAHTQDLASVKSSQAKFPKNLGVRVNNPLDIIDVSEQAIMTESAADQSVTTIDEAVSKLREQVIMYLRKECYVEPLSVAPRPSSDIEKVMYRKVWEIRQLANGLEYGSELESLRSSAEVSDRVKTMRRLYKATLVLSRMVGGVKHDYYYKKLGEIEKFDKKIYNVSIILSSYLHDSFDN